MDSFFYNFDCFKTPLTYRINGKRSFFTKFGCLMSLPLVFVLFGIFATSDEVLKLHPIISSRSFAEDTRPYLRFDKSNMTFAFRVINENSTANIDPSYFSLTISNIFVNNTSHEVMRTDNKKTKVCDVSDFIDSGYYNTYKIINATCVAENSTFEIGGYWTDPFLSYIKVTMTACKNESESAIVCKSQEEIKYFLKNSFFYVYYNDRNYDLNNYKNPIKSFYTTQNQMIDANIRKRMTLFFQKVQLINDQGLVLDNNEATESFLFDRMESDFSTQMDDLDSIFEVFIYSSRETENLMRRYEKIIKTLSNLGGISYFMIFLEYIIVMDIREYCLMKRLVNFLYIFPKKKSLKQNNSSEMQSDIVSNSSTKKEKPEISKKNVIEIIPIANDNLASFSKEKNTSERQSEIVSNSSTKKEKLEISKKNAIELIPIPKDNLAKDNATNSNFILPKIIIDDIPDLGSLENIEKKFPEQCVLTLDKKLKIPNEEAGSIEKEMIKGKKLSKISSFFRKKELDKFKNFAHYQQNENVDNNLDIGFWEYMKLKFSLFCKCQKLNSTQKLFEKAKKMALQEMDFFLIMQKLQEIEKIKLVLLSPEQIKLFNLLTKPMIFEQDGVCEELQREDGFAMSVMLENSKKLSDRMVMKDVLEYYRKVKDNKGDEIDERLIMLVDKPLEQFENYYRKHT